MKAPDGPLIKVLLVEDSPSDAALLQDQLLAVTPDGFVFTRVECLQEAIGVLPAQPVDVMLLDLTLPDSAGADTFIRARAAAPQIPIIVLTGMSDECLGAEALRRGIQDYLVKGQTDGRKTVRAIHYAIERKRLEETLRESERRFRALFEQAAVGVAQVDSKTGKFLQVNLKCCDVLGYSREEMLQLTFQQITHPEDLLRDLDYRNRLIAGQLQQYSIEKRCFKKDGSVVWVNLTVSSLAQRGVSSDSHVTIAVDITRRKRAEEALERAWTELEQKVQERTNELSQMNASLRQEIEVRRQAEAELSEAEFRYRTVAEFTYDWEYWQRPDGIMRYCSPSCERIVGYSAQEFLADPHLLDCLVHPDDIEIWSRHRQQTLATAGPQTIQFRMTHKNRHVCWIEHVCQPVRGKDGQYLGVRASNRDVTQRIEADLEQQRLREDLARIARITTTGQFAASLAHELNQPLTAIYANTQAMERFLAAPQLDLKEMHEVLDDIRYDSQRASKVIQRLRALFQKTGQEHSVLTLNEIIQETTGLLQSEFVLKDISVHYQLDPSLPRVSGNRVELQQVVLNLIMNAMEAMCGLEPNLRQLRITTSREAPRRVRVAICDAGPGVPLSQLDRLFEPFFTTKVNGMGMGLVICHTIIAAHNGILRAVNNPDRGATFYFDLPICAEVTA